MGAKGFWVSCLMLSDDDGALPSIEDIGWALRLDPSEATSLMTELEMSRLVTRDVTGNVTLYRLHDWHEHQYKSDADPTAKDRKQRQREREKAQKSNVTRDVTHGHDQCHAPVTRTDTDTDTDNKKGIGGLEEKGETGLGNDDAALIANSWNLMAEDHGLPQVKRITPGRRQKIKDRAKDAGGLIKLVEVIEQIPSQPFLLGKNQRGWKADLDWILEPRNFVKLEERKFANGHG